MSAHLLFEDFFRFLDALDSPGSDPWGLYEEHYLDLHRVVLTAWWEQCIGRDRGVWMDRVRRVRPEEYGLLRDLVRDADLAGVAGDTMARCQGVLPQSPEPEVYFLVGFFSPDGFAFRVEGRWSIGIGLERLPREGTIPILLAHEYLHCYRNRIRPPRTLGERMVAEGFAVELAARAFPERPREQYLAVRPGQLAAFREYEEDLWKSVRPLLNSEDEELTARVLYGRAGPGKWPSRAGIYLGWRAVTEFLATTAGAFDATPEQVLQLVPQTDP